MASSHKFGTSLTLREHYGFWSGELKLPKFGELLGSKRLKVLVEIEMGDDDELDPAVRSGIEWLVENEAAVAKSVLAAIEPKTGIDLRSVHFHRAVRGKAPYLGFLFGRANDGEHGLGVMMHGTRAVEVGGADTGILEWIAERDAKAKKTKPKAKR